MKWEGYSEKFNSWEPAANFLNSDLITQFEATLKASREAKYTLQALGTKASEESWEGRLGSGVLRCGGASG